MRPSSALFGILLFALQPGLALASQPGVACGAIAHVLTERVIISDALALPAACDPDDLAQVWSLGSGVHAMRCALPQPVNAEEGANSGGLFIQRDGQDLFSLQGNAIPAMDGNDGLVVLRSDLSGDGAPETILAAHQSESQGLGVNLWTLYVFDAHWNLLGSRTDVADWGPRSFVSRATAATVTPTAGVAGCALLLTDWREFEAAGGRAETWLVGTRADIRGEPLDLVSEPEPLASRRLDRRFAAERRRDIALTDSRLREPTVWLAREIERALQEDHPR